MSELLKKHMDSFLKDLTKLTKKHGIAIGGCGCCESPFLCYEKRKGQYIMTDQLKYEITNEKPEAENE